MSVLWLRFVLRKGGGDGEGRGGQGKCVPSPLPFTFLYSQPFYKDNLVLICSWPQVILILGAIPIGGL